MDPMGIFEGVLVFDDCLHVVQPDFHITMGQQVSPCFLQDQGVMGPL